MSPVDIALVEAYLSNMHLALQNLNVPCAESLLEHALELLVQPCTIPPLPMQIEVGIGLDTGIQRKGKPNEDFVFATVGCAAHMEETYGLFVVADGMGGHARGQDASRLATQTIIDTLFPLIRSGQVQENALGNALIDAVNEANTAIYKRNRDTTSSRFLDQMGTTVTTALVMGPHAFIANVGDSRTYLYRPGVGLRAITHDHSVVAELVASGVISPEEIYRHPERHKILRCLGATPTVEVDVFYEQLQDGDILLCCSDGMWEMMRDPQIEQILSSSWLSVEHMAARLMHAALQGGGLDNIGLVVSQFQMNMTAMQTIVCPLSPSAAIAIS
jgi:serine/threonine protein phosphatase PrpC